MRQFMRAAVAVAALGCALPAAAQEYPSRTVRVIVQSPPGGLQDIIARATSQGLSKRWGQPVIVENHPSAGGILAANTVARSKPDGYTILQTGQGTILANEFMRKDLPYDSRKDFAPVVVLINSRNIMVGSPKMPFNNVKELVAFAKANPGTTLFYGSLGIGHATHIDVEAFLRNFGIAAKHVPYKGGVPAMQALAANEIHFAITGITAAIPLVKAGSLKGLGYAGLKRSEIFPDMPTIHESGYPGFESGSWFAWFVPTGTPQAIIARIGTEARSVLSEPENKAKFVIAGGHELSDASASEVGAILDRERKFFAEKLKPLNLKIQQ